MSSSVGVVELEPLASESLSRRFPHLRAAMDPELMSRRLQTALFGGTGLELVVSGVPKAQLAGNACWLQYAVRQPAATPGGTAEILILGTMFAERAEASILERSVLAPLARRWQIETGGSAWHAGILNQMALALSVFPVSARLPTLIEAASPRRVTALLASIGAINRTAIVENAELVRFRRVRGCVLRYRLRTGDESTVIYGKVGVASAASDPSVIRDTLVALRGRTSGSSEPIHLPRVLLSVPELSLTLMAEVPGSRPDPRVEGDVLATVTGAARAAAMLHSCGTAAGNVRNLDVELARAREPVTEIPSYAPDLARWLGDILDALAGSGARTPAQTLAPAHGDFTPSQVVLAGSKVGVLDFDGLCLAEPAFDLGRFIAYLRVALAKAGNPAADQMASTFVSAYLANGGRSTPEGRIELYEMLSLVRMAAHSWLQLKSRRLQLVSGVLSQRLEQVNLPPLRQAPVS